MPYDSFVIPDETQAHRIEDLLLKATQPAQQLQYDGWLLRLAQNDVKRARSVNPIYGSSLPVEEKIAYCERVYEEQGLPPLYRMSALSKPSTLDEALKLRGYELFERSLVMVAMLDDGLPAIRDGLRFEQPPLERWLQLVAPLRGLTPKAASAEYVRLSQTALDEIPIAVWRGNELAGCGLMMMDGEYAGLFDIATLPSLRRQRVGLATCVHLLQLAQERGAIQAWLSVVADNEPALRLYERLGFAPVYDYWYRIKHV